MTFISDDQKRGEALNDVFYHIDEDAIARAVLSYLDHEHRTLQQVFWRAVQKVAKEYGTNRHSDLRNEASVAYAKAVADLQGDHHLPLI